MPSSADCARTSWTKNRISVAGIAAAMPLTTNTASSQRKAGFASGAKSCDSGVGVAGRSAGRGARNSVIPAPASRIGTNTTLKLRSPEACVPSPASTSGSTAAASTPTTPAAPRAAVTRVRS